MRYGSQYERYIVYSWGRFIKAFKSEEEAIKYAENLSKDPNESLITVNHEIIETIWRPNDRL